MSKQSERARKEARAQARRAIDDGDLGAIEALANASADRAASALVQVLAQDSRPPGASALAERLARRFRMAGNLGAAKSIAAAGKESARGLRLELALACFALGEDDAAADEAKRDELVEEIVGPLLRCARGEAAAPRGRQKRREDVAALLEAARAVSFARAGREADARRVAAGAPSDHRSALQHTITLAKRPRAEVVSGRRTRGATTKKVAKAKAAASAQELIEASQAIAVDPSVNAPIRDVAALELAESAPADASRLIRDWPNRAELAPQIACRQELRDADAASRPERVVRLAAMAGADAFDARDAASAWLYRGFGLASRDVREAQRALDKAIELGADLTEALRGKFLAAWFGGVACDGCGELHGDPHQVGATADRLAGALQRAPLGKPYAAAALRLAAEAWLDDGTGVAALAAIRRARAFATESQVARLDVVEAEATMLSGDMRASLDFATRAFDRDTKNVPAALVKIRALQQLGRDEDAAAFAKEASKLTGDPDLARIARAAVASSAAPFEGVEGLTTAGALAAELERATRAMATSADETAADDPMTDAAWACRGALSEGARVAFDLAMLAIAHRYGRPAMSSRLADIAVRWAPHGPPLDRILTVANDIGLAPDCGPALAALAARRDGAGCIAAMLRALAGIEVDTTSRLMAQHAAALSRGELDSIRAALAAPPRKRDGTVLRAIERELEPEFDLHAEADDFDESELDADFLGELDGGAGGRASQFPPELRALLTPELRARLGRVERGEGDLVEAEQTVSDIIDFVSTKLGGKPPSFGKGKLAWP